MGNGPSRTLTVPVFPVTVTERLAESLLSPRAKSATQEDQALYEGLSVSTSLRKATDLVESAAVLSHTTTTTADKKASELLAPVSDCFKAHQGTSLDCWPQVQEFKDKVSQASRASLLTM